MLQPIVVSQYLESDPRYALKKAENQEAQQGQLRSHEELIMSYQPGLKYTNIDEYTFDMPLPTEYKVGLLLDPCKEHLELNTDPEGAILGGWDCCINVYGLPEYGQALSEFEDGNYRRAPIFKLNELTDILANGNIVNEEGDLVPYLNSRRADDEAIVDEECLGKHDPYTYCVGYRKKEQRFSIYPNCTDHNTTVRADTKCFDMGALSYDQKNTHEFQHEPIERDFCVQIAYMQTAHNMICNENSEYADDPHCGTYLEVHVPSGTFYTDFDESFIVNQVKITSRYTSGYDTVALPLYYGGRTDWVVCNYAEDYIRVGSMVLIKTSAPRCCCPKQFQDTTFEGHFFCPRNVNDVTVAGFSAGPFSTLVDTLLEDQLDEIEIDIYPYCPYLEPNQDIMMCSKFTTEDDKGNPILQYTQVTREGGTGHKHKRLTNNGISSFNDATTFGKRYFSEACELVTQLNKTESVENGFWASSELRGAYKFQCPYFPECGMPAGNQRCNASTPNANGIYDIYDADFEYSFKGFIGKVTSAPGEGEDGPYMVSFNDGRTSYPFELADLELHRLDYNYELWWVQRTSYNFIVNKRKGFRVTEPTCTFDFNNNQYFPYAIILNHETCPLCQMTDPFGEPYTAEPCFASTYPLSAQDAPLCLMTEDQGYADPSPDQDPMYEKYGDYAGT